MCEVTIDNFSDVLENIKQSFKKARFITLDTEFSSLNISERTQNSLFDTPKERYEKLYALCEQIIPMQIGISAFTFNPDKNSYLADMYTFYVFPKKFNNINPMFIFQSASLQFLCTYNFDFNKFMYKGLSYINRNQEIEIRDLQNNISAEFDDHDLEALILDHGTNVLQWINTSKEGDKLILPGILSKHRNNLDMLYYFHKHLRKRFNNKIWTMEENKEFVIKKVSDDEYIKLDKENNLDESVLNGMLGFTNIFRLLVDLKKPIVGHNLLTDLMIMYHRFETPLPKSYKKFKKEIINLFPIIYDTKCITFELKKEVPENKMWDRNTLEVLYNYFKDGYGRHLVLNSPLIELVKQPDQDQFHNAGWDSYCTGYIFIRMAHIFAVKNCSTKSKFMYSELSASIHHIRNCVNVIRCSTSYINLDGNDPASLRPPRLIVESAKGVPLDIALISCLLSSYGYIEIKPYSQGGRRAIVAVDNFASARRILRQYKSHDEFHIKQYSLIKHSPMARAVMWTGVLTSGAILAWLTYSTLKN